MSKDRTITLTLDEAVCLLVAIDREIDHEIEIANELQSKIDVLYKDHRDFVQGMIDRRWESVEKLRAITKKIDDR